MDGNPITTRTKSAVASGKIHRLPSEQQGLVVFYNENYGGESPGVSMYCTQVEAIDNVYKFLDYHMRRFELTVDGEGTYDET